MKDLHPLSDLLNQLQKIAKVKDGSKLVGSEFQNEYTDISDPEKMRNQVSFAGGDVQTAYSNLKSAYDIAKNANSDNRNDHKIHGDKNRSLNTEVVSGNMRHAEKKLTSAVERLKEYNVGPIEQLRDIRSKIKEHRKTVENTGIVFFN